MKKIMVLLIGCLCLCSLGCTKYSWGGYNKHLLSHFKKSDIAALDKSLTADVQQAESNHKVPPGLYGELGFVKYEQGHYDQAIRYFEKERTLWPESAALMDKMVRNAKNGGKMQM
jgi:hypothetical protein